MTQHGAFIAAILANPTDDLPRLVYADWLDENGQPEEAAFIRAQITLAKVLVDPKRDKRLDEPMYRLGYFLAYHREKAAVDIVLGEPMPCHCEKCLRDQEREAFAAYCDRYHSEAPGISTLLPHLNESGGPSVEYRRGFVHTVTCSLGLWVGGPCERCVRFASVVPACPECGGAGRTHGIGPAVVAAHPVERVVVTDRRTLPSGDCVSWYRDVRGAAINAVHTLPTPIYDGLSRHWRYRPDGEGRVMGQTDIYKVYSSEDDAHSDLSDALIAWAKSQPHPARITSTPVSVDLTAG